MALRTVQWLSAPSYVLFGLTAAAGLSSLELRAQEQSPVQEQAGALQEAKAEEPKSAPSPEGLQLQSTYSEIKSPGQFITSLTRSLKPDWSAQFRPPISSVSNSRAQTAFTLGSVFAEGYLAAQSEDMQQCKNISKDLLALARPLGVQNELMDRTRSLADCADRRDWNLLRQELEASQGDIRNALHKHQDDELMTLITLGAWMRSTEIAASVVKNNYTPDAALLLHQPALAQLLTKQLDSLGEKLQSDPVVSLLRPRFSQISAILAGGPETAPSPEEVQDLSQAVSSLLLEITTRKPN